MTSLMDSYCHDEMLFSDVYHDQIPGLTADIQPHAFRVGSYTGSDCEQQYRSFPTPPDSPVFAELTPPNSSQTKAASTAAGSHMQSTGMLPGDSGLLAAHNLDMNALLDSCLSTVYNNIPDHMDPLCDPIYQSELMQSHQNVFIKQELQDAFSSQPDMSMNWNFQPSFAESLEDYPVPSPTPSPQFDSDIFTGDLKDLDRILNFGDQGLMHTLQTRPHMTYGHSAGEESDMDSGSEASFSLSVPEVPGYPAMHQQVTSTIPAAHHHHHHHHHHPQQQHHHHHHQQQQQQNQQPQAYHSASRTHNYQCRTLHKTLETLGNHTDGFISQDPLSVQQQVGAIGPIRKQHRGRPRKRSVTSSDDGCSDEEQVVTTTGVSGGITQSKRGRGRREAMKGNHLWEFIRDLLKSDSFCPKYIRWEDREAGVFRFVNSEAVANMWGRKKNNPQMTYEKLSRAMRYYYKREILERVDGRRLVYKFGKNADGWKEAAGLQ